MKIIIGCVEALMRSRSRSGPRRQHGQHGSEARTFCSQHLDHRQQSNRLYDRPPESRTWTGISRMGKRKNENTNLQKPHVCEPDPGCRQANSPAKACCCTFRSTFFCGLCQHHLIREVRRLTPALLSSDLAQASTSGRMSEECA